MILDALPLFLTNLTVILVLMTGFWLLSLIVRDVSFVDSVWGLGFPVIAWITFFVTGGWETPPRLLLAVLSTIWGLRLAVHLFLRWLREGPDRRYENFIGRQKMNPKLFSLIFVFLLQGVLLTIIATPLQMGQIPATPLSGSMDSVLVSAGVFFWATGFFFEAVGDWQLARFRADPRNEDKVLSSGLWRYTRHPNYFGDACVFWGYYLIAAASPVGIWSFFGPAILTVILLKWSGVALMEKTIAGRRPDYENYKKRTSAFIPMPPEKQ